MYLIDAAMTEQDILTHTSAPVSARVVEVTVADNGPGIDPALIDALFVPGRTSKEGGHGVDSQLLVRRGPQWQVASGPQRQQGSMACMDLHGSAGEWLLACV